MWVQNFQTCSAANQGHSRTWPAAPLASPPTTLCFRLYVHPIWKWPVTLHIAHSYFIFCDFSLSSIFLIKNCQESEILPHLHDNKVTCHNVIRAGRRYETPGTITKDFITLSTQVHVLHICCLPWPAKCPEGHAEVGPGRCCAHSASGSGWEMSSLGIRLWADLSHFGPVGGDRFFQSERH